MHIDINWADLGLAARIVAMDSVRAELVDQTVHALGQQVLKAAAKGNTSTGDSLWEHLAWTTKHTFNGSEYFVADKVLRPNSRNAETMTDIEREFVIAALEAGGIKVRRDYGSGRYFILSW